MTLTTLRLSSSGNIVAVREKGAGAPVLLIHGVGMQSAAWGPQIAALSETHRVMAVDMPGHGGSAQLTPDSQLPNFVAWCHDVVRTLDVGPVNIAGHSMGALIAGGFAVKHPELTARVCLINGVYCRDDAAAQAVTGRAADIRAGQFDLNTPLNRWFDDSPVDCDVRTQVSDWLGTVDRSGYATAYDAFAKGDATYAAEYAGITCPFLAITGGDDPNSTPAMSRMMVADAPNGHAITVEGHRHMVNLTAPDVINRHLKNWLNMPTKVRELQ